VNCSEVVENLILIRVNSWNSWRLLFILLATNFTKTITAHLDAIGLKYDLSQSLPAALRDTHF